MRLFTGLDLSIATLDQFLSALRPAAPNLQWSPLKNLHITTKFIGEWPEPRLGELTQVLQGIQKPGLLRIHMRGVGWFPDPHQPRYLFAAVEASQQLLDLARDTQNALAVIGVKVEDRAYTPHVTLARVRAAELAALQQAIAEYGSLDFGMVEAKSFALYVSVMSVYTKLAEFPLQ